MLQLQPIHGTFMKIKVVVHKEVVNESAEKDAE
jgi:hypothetical protein